MLNNKLYTYYIPNIGGVSCTFFIFCEQLWHAIIFDLLFLFKGIGIKPE